MASALSTNKDEFSIDIDWKRYRGMIGSLLYSTTSRFDIMFTVCLCARYQASPKESHFKIVKRILRYLCQTTHFGLWYPKEGYYCLVEFSDSDFAGCKLDRKSTGETCHLFGSFLISWHRRKQNNIALSTVEAKYVAAGSCCSQILLLKQNLLCNISPCTMLFSLAWTESCLFLSFCMLYLVHVPFFACLQVFNCGLACMFPYSF